MESALGSDCRLRPDYGRSMVCKCHFVSDGKLLTISMEKRELTQSVFLLNTVLVAVMSIYSFIHPY